MLNFNGFIKNQSQKWLCQEVFNQHFSFKIDQKTEKSVSYKFVTSNEQNGEIVFEKRTPRDKPEYWDLSFSINNKHILTNGGEAFKIFATVLEACRDFLYQKENVNIIKFSADKTNNDSRSSLYSAMIKKMSKQFGFESEEKISSLGTTFTLKKIYK